MSQQGRHLQEAVNLVTASCEWPKHGLRCYSSCLLLVVSWAVDNMQMHHQHGSFSIHVAGLWCCLWVASLFQDQYMVTLCVIWSKALGEVIVAGAGGRPGHHECSPGSRHQRGGLRSPPISLCQPAGLHPRLH